MSKHRIQIILISTTLTCFHYLAGYEILSHLTSLYKREYTVLDLLNNNGTFYNFASQKQIFTYVVLQNKITEEYTNSVKKLANIILLEYKWTLDDLKQLSECEYFDIVLFPATLFSEKNQECLMRILIDLGAIVAISSDKNIELAPPITRALSTKDYYEKVLYKDDSLIIFQNNQKILKKGWLRGNHKKYTIFNNFNEKYFTKTLDSIPKIDVAYFRRNAITSQTIFWKTGINLWTYIMFNGIYPSKDFVKAKLLKLSNDAEYNKIHLDNNAWNFIIQGNEIIPIDCQPNYPNTLKNQAKKRRRLDRLLKFLYHPPYDLEYIQ